MRWDLRDGICLWRRFLRAAFGSPYTAPEREDRDMHRPGQDPHLVTDRENELHEATDQMRAAADHGKSMARLISHATDPNHPDSFESEMRRLLGRVE